MSPIWEIDIYWYYYLPNRGYCLFFENRGYPADIRNFPQAAADVYLKVNRNRFAEVRGYPADIRNFPQAAADV